MVRRPVCWSGTRRRSNRATCAKRCSVRWVPGLKTGMRDVPRRRSSRKNRKKTQRGEQAWGCFFCVSFDSAREAFRLDGGREGTGFRAEAQGRRAGTDPGVLRKAVSASCALYRQIASPLRLRGLAAYPCCPLYGHTAEAALQSREKGVAAKIERRRKEGNRRGAALLAPLCVPCGKSGFRLGPGMPHALGAKAAKSEGGLADGQRRKSRKAAKPRR